MFQDLGAERIFKMGEGDELCGQEESFRNWTKEIFKVCHLTPLNQLEFLYLINWTSPFSVGLAGWYLSFLFKF